MLNKRPTLQVYQGSNPLTILRNLSLTDFSKNCVWPQQWKWPIILASHNISQKDDCYRTTLDEYPKSNFFQNKKMQFPIKRW